MLWTYFSILSIMCDNVCKFFCHTKIIVKVIRSN